MWDARRSSHPAPPRFARGASGAQLMRRRAPGVGRKREQLGKRCVLVRVVLVGSVPTMPTTPSENTLRIVLTGGPGGGKTTAADLLRREFSQRVALVPETATMLFTGGFPRVEAPDAVCAAQTAIYNVQCNLEEVQAARYPGQILLCDRGTVDGAAYWPEEHGDFFDSLGTTLEDELARYHYVIFFETAAVGGHSIASGNPARIESEAAAVALDARLKGLWSQHPRFHFIPHGPSFLAKITSALHTLTEILAGARNHHS